MRLFSTHNLKKTKAFFSHEKQQCKEKWHEKRMGRIVSLVSHESMGEYRCCCSCGNEIFKKHVCDVTMFSSKLVNYDYAILFDTKFTVFGLFFRKITSTMNISNCTIKQ